MPAPETSSDEISIRRLPTRGSIQPASGPATKAASDSGRMYSAACIGDMPCTSCRRWLKTSSMPSAAAAKRRGHGRAEDGVAEQREVDQRIGRARWRRANTSIATPAAQARPACSQDGAAMPSCLRA